MPRVGLTPAAVVDAAKTGAVLPDGERGELVFTSLTPAGLTADDARAAPPRPDRCSPTG